MTAAQTAALVLCRGHPPEAPLLEALASQVATVLIVVDGPSPGASRLFARRAAAVGAQLLWLPVNQGKGHALRLGIEHLKANGAHPVLTFDADGQHPTAAIPSFLAAAASAELVIGDRFAGGGHIPFQRRVANRVASAALARLNGTAIPDSQCGMRLLRGRALDVPMPHGGFEAETIHLRRCLRVGVAVAWVPIPAIYDGAESSFRALRDSGRVAWAVVRPGA